MEYDTNVGAGVTPGKGGSEVHGVPVFDTVEEAVKNTGANPSVFFVPSFFVLDAFYETVEAGIKFVVVVGMGADPVVLMNLTEIIEFFQKEEHTERIIIIGEVGGAQEELAAHYIKEHVGKPISAYIAGKLSPPQARGWVMPAQ